MPPLSSPPLSEDDTEDKIPCPYCSLYLDSEEEYEKHFKARHEGRLLEDAFKLNVCVFCELSTKDTLREHYRVCPFKDPPKPRFFNLVVPPSQSVPEKEVAEQSSSTTKRLIKPAKKIKKIKGPSIQSRKCPFCKLTLSKNASYFQEHVATHFKVPMTKTIDRYNLGSDQSPCIFCKETKGIEKTFTSPFNFVRHIAVLHCLLEVFLTPEHRDFIFQDKPPPLPVDWSNRIDLSQINVEEIYKEIKK